MPVPPLPELSAFLSTVKNRWPRLETQPPENLHITLKFLGETGEDFARRAETALTAALAGVPGFAVSLAGLGVFPPVGAPRVLWIGIQEGERALAELAARIEDALAKAGFSREKRRYEPHVTLARFAQGDALPLDVKEHEGRALGRFQADRVLLMRSDIHPSRPSVYTPRKEFRLGK